MPAWVFGSANGPYALTARTDGPRGDQGMAPDRTGLRGGVAIRIERAPLGISYGRLTALLRRHAAVTEHGCLS